MIERIRKTIIDNNMLNPGDTIITGVSGGPDSICLLHILYSLKEQLGIKKLICVHINHMIRGEEADSDEKYVEEFCIQLGIQCVVRRIDVKSLALSQSVSEEVAGRNARYDTFGEICRQNGSSTVAVAHNMDDQAETILMRIIRGTGLRGMSGMSYSRELENGISIIRPLLNTTRADIEEYCRVNNLNPHTDKTNLEPVYTRNKLRLELLPYIRDNFNENITATICRLSEIASEAESFISESTDSFFIKNWTQNAIPHSKLKCQKDKCSSFPLKTVRELPHAMKTRVIIEAFRRIGLEKNVSTVHVNAAIKVIDSTRGNKEVEFPSYYVMYINEGKIWFAKKS